MRFIFVYLLLLVSFLLPAAGFSAPSVTPQSKLQQTQTPQQTGPETEDIHDIKGPVPLPDKSPFFIFVAAVIVLTIGAVFLFFFLKRHRTPKETVSLPDVTALAELDRARSLMEQPLVYAERISAILRLYIEKRFQIRSTRQTTQEFFSRLQEGTTIAEVDLKNHAGTLQPFLEQCDIAKFAHGRPNTDTMIQMEQAARNFIESTRQKQP
jgi:hypothetical protein